MPTEAAEMILLSLSILFLQTITLYAHDHDVPPLPTLPSDPLQIHVEATIFRRDEVSGRVLLSLVVLVLLYIGMYHINKVILDFCFVLMTVFSFINYY